MTWQIFEKNAIEDLRALSLGVKILHLATSRSGGAGVAALRLAEVQQGDLRTEVRVHTPRNDSYLTRRSLNQLMNTLISKVVTAAQQTLTSKGIAFVSPISVSRLNWKIVEDFSPDVVHIHNWYNFLSLGDIKLLLTRYRVVFTAHDERLLTGGCHITFGCNRYHKGCGSCPQVQFGSRLISNSADDLHQLLSNSRNYSIIAPSKWLKEKFQSAEFVNQASKIASIPNVIPAELTLNLNQNREVSQKFLFVTDSATSSNKGMPEVLEAMNQLSDLNPQLNFELQIAGIENHSCSTNRPNLRVRFLGILDENEMRVRYRVVDALIVASKSENSPNVISEAQIYGAIAIGHAVGGIPEMINHPETGILYQTGKDTLLSALTEFLGISEDKRDLIRRAARENAVSRHETGNILNETYAVYAELLERDSN